MSSINKIRPGTRSGVSITPRPMSLSPLLYKSPSLLHFSQCLVHLVLPRNTSALLSTITMMKSTAGSSNGSMPKPNTMSSARKLVTQVRDTCKDISPFQDGLLSFMYAVSLNLELTSKSQEVLLYKIESIAQRVENLSKEVLFLRQAIDLNIEMNSRQSFEFPSMTELEAYLDSPMPIQEPGPSVDLQCYETPLSSYGPSLGPTYIADGSTGLPEWASQEWPTN